MPGNEDPPLAARYVVRRAGPSVWVFQDDSIPVDKDRTIARIHEVDDNVVDVVWLWAVPLPTRYINAETVREDFERWRTLSDAHSRPIPIPHLPPLPADGES